MPPRSGAPLHPVWKGGCSGDRWARYQEVMAGCTVCSLCPTPLLARVTGQVHTHLWKGPESNVLPCPAVVVKACRPVTPKEPLSSPRKWGTGAGGSVPRARLTSFSTKNGERPDSKVSCSGVCHQGHSVGSGAAGAGVGVGRGRTCWPLVLGAPTQVPR